MGGGSRFAIYWIALAKCNAGILLRSMQEFRFSGLPIRIPAPPGFLTIIARIPIRSSRAKLMRFCREKSRSMRFARLRHRSPRAIMRDHNFISRAGPLFPFKPQSLYWIAYIVCKLHGLQGLQYPGRSHKKPYNVYRAIPVLSLTDNS
jgi:hypothetical protein